ncbi:MAG: tetraacyldisaccharide 4'-kinase [Pirellulales bacterium]
MPHRWSESTFREIVSGRRRGAAAALARGVLRLAEVPYTAAVGWRNRRFDQAHSAVRRVGVPVVSVGNLTMGGTGKTPMVKWIARQFADRGVRVAIVSRGYGAAEGGKNDEALELEQALPGVLHVQNPDRVEGAEEAIRRGGARLILLDDGFQHRRLARDLDIVLLDASAPFGFEHVFPRGMLREPVSGLERAQVVCLTRADLLCDGEREAIRRRVAELAPAAAWCEAVHAPSRLQNNAGASQSLESLAARRVAAFCAIGNPAAFRRTLESQGASIVFWREFPDHHAYSRIDCEELAAAVAASGAELAVVTHKDLVKLPLNAIGAVPLWALVIDMRFTVGEAAVVHALDDALKPT